MGVSQTYMDFVDKHIVKQSASKETKTDSRNGNGHRTEESYADSLIRKVEERRGNVDRLLRKVAGTSYDAVLSEWTAMKKRGAIKLFVEQEPVIVISGSGLTYDATVPYHITTTQLAANRALVGYPRPGIGIPSPLSDDQKEMVIDFKVHLAESEPSTNGLMRAIARATEIPEYLVRHYVKEAKRKEAVTEALDLIKSGATASVVQASAGHSITILKGWFALEHKDPSLLTPGGREAKNITVHRMRN